MFVEIYGKDACPYCDMAKRKAEEFLNCEFVYKKLGVDFTREELLEKFPDARTFPQITVDGVSIGGWTEFQKVQ